VIQPLGLSTQIDLDVAQRLAVGQLSKGHGQELVHAGEVLNFVIASVLGNAAAKRAQRQEGHELRENELATRVRQLIPDFATFAPSPSIQIKHLREFLGRFLKFLVMAR
jgi:hypothetical protein